MYFTGTENKNNVTVVQCTGEGMAGGLNVGERRRSSRGSIGVKIMVIA